MSSRKPDTNSPAVDAAQAIGLVAVPFLVAVFVGLIVIGKAPLFGIGGGADHGEHGGEHAAEAPAEAAH